MPKPVRTALLGGTFNPLHNGHLAIAKSVLEQDLADEVWLLVTPCNPWKVNQEMIDDRVRYQMAAQAVKNIKGIKASDYEFSLPQPSYTANTLRHLSADYPDRQFILTIGADTPFSISHSGLPSSGFSSGVSSGITWSSVSAGSGSCPVSSSFVSSESSGIVSPLTVSSS